MTKTTFDLDLEVVPANDLSPDEHHPTCSARLGEQVGSPPRPAEQWTTCTARLATNAM